MVRFVVLCAVAAGVTLAAQQTTFQSRVETVAVYATVNDRGGRLVTDLQKDDFTILDNSRPVEITVFSNEIKTITAVLMLDLSTSMISRVQWMRDASFHFIDALSPADRASIGSFGDEIAVNPNLTSNKAILKRVIDEELWPGGSTPVWRVIDESMNALRKDAGRRVVVILTDGDNTIDGGVDDGDLKKRGVAENFMVYAVSVNNKGLSGRLKNLAEETGGGHIEIGDGDDVKGAITHVVEELRHQYLLGFAPAALDGQVHTLSIQLRDKTMKARAPRGYLAATKTP